MLHSGYEVHHYPSENAFETNQVQKTGAFPSWKDAWNWVKFLERQSASFFYSVGIKPVKSRLPK